MDIKYIIDIILSIIVNCITEYLDLQYQHKLFLHLQTDLGSVDIISKFFYSTQKNIFLFTTYVNKTCVLFRSRYNKLNRENYGSGLLHPMTKIL